MVVTMKQVKSTHVRICMPSVKFVDFNRETNEFTGLFKEPAKFVFGIFSETFNVSLTTVEDDSPINFDPNSKQLPGCFGVLQRGEADVSLYPFKMPIFNIENVTQVNSSALQTGTYMLAPYSRNESGFETVRGPLDSFSSVSLDTWTNGAVFIIVFAVLMYYMKLFVYRPPSEEDEDGQPSEPEKEEDEALYGQSLLYQVITHMMQYETCDYTGDTIRYVSLLMSIFAYLFITLFSCMITSEQVSTNNFQVYDTYEKILSNPNVQPVWVKNLDDYSQYMRAGKGSMQAALWQQSLSIYTKDNSRGMFFDSDPMSVISKGPAASRKEFVVFLANMFTELIVSIVCSALSCEHASFERVKNLRLKGRLDEHVPTSLYVVPISLHSSVGEVCEYGMQRLIEPRLLHQPDIRRMVETFFAKQILGSKIRYNEDFYQCLDFEKLPTADSKFSPLMLKNTGDVFRWWTYGCALSFFVLLCEHLHHWLWGKKSRRERRTSPVGCTPRVGSRRSI